MSFDIINQLPVTDIFIYMLKMRMKQNINFLNKKREDVETKHFNYSKAFIEYPTDMDDICKNIEQYNQTRKRKILIHFDDMIVDILCNRKFNSIVTELFNRGRKLDISIVLITQSYFPMPKNTR